MWIIALVGLGVIVISLEFLIDLNKLITKNPTTFLLVGFFAFAVGMLVIENQTSKPFQSQQTANNKKLKKVNKTTNVINLAKKGDAKSQLELSTMFFYGKGVAEDDEQSFYWARKAAEQGFLEAEFVLGLKYSEGNGASLDYEKSLYWFRKSANAGHKLSQHQLGNMYYTGIKNFLSKDLDKAYYWYKKAGSEDMAKMVDSLKPKKIFNRMKQLAENGDTEAYVALGFYYKEGKLVPKNLKKTIYWYKKAADKGHAKAQFFLAGVLLNSKSKKQQSYDLIKKSANNGYIYAQLSLGNMYFKGKGVAMDQEKSFYWIRKAAEQGDPSSQFQLGLKYEQGLGASKNLNKAYQWIKKAAEQGDQQAKIALANYKVSY